MSGNENDNKVIKTDVPLPVNNTEEFTDRPAHRRNKPE